MKIFKKGFSLIELVVYMGLLSVISITLIASFLPITRSLREFEAAKDIKNSALLSMDNMIREIRTATDINILSVFDSNPGRLVLSVPDGLGGTVISDFYILSSTLRFTKNGVDMGPITGLNIEVSNLVFKSSQNGNAKLIKIEMTLKSKNIPERFRDFYTSVILRSTEKE